MTKCYKISKNVLASIATTLPEFKGYTVDMRLSQFRKVTHGKLPSIDFISFDSEEGKRLLIGYIQSLDELPTGNDYPTQNNDECSHNVTVSLGKVLGYYISQCKRCGKHFL